MNIDIEIIEDPRETYKGNCLLYKDEVYDIISCCFEVHNNLGRRFLEVVYKDALMLKFNLRGMQFSKEKKIEIQYKNTTLQHYYYSDFVVHDKILPEVKAQSGILGEHYKQVINYLAVSGLKFRLLVNFGEHKIQFKRIIL